MTESQHVFTYGSLMFPAVWERVVLGAYLSADATVQGFRRLRVRDEKYPALVVDANADALIGRVYFKVSSIDIQRLDHFETSEYARVGVSVQTDGKATVAQAYMTLNPENLERREWSPTEFEQHGLESFLATYAATNAPPPNL